MIALGGVLQATTNALNGIQIPGPKSVLGALLSVVIALEVGLPRTNSRKPSGYSIL